jgi:DNA invertase Pin-like site-specific DNA recombinase
MACSDPAVQHHDLDGPNVLLSFAQFERELAGERIRDKFAASRRLARSLQ